jgi:hypothetical protein
MEEGQGEGFDYEAKDAFKAFVTYMRDQNPKYHCSKEDFRSGMEALGFPYGRRTLGRIGIGRMVFRGIRPRQDDGSVTLPPDVFGNGGSKVVQFPTTEKKEK